MNVAARGRPKKSSPIKTDIMKEVMRERGKKSASPTPSKVGTPDPETDIIKRCVYCGKDLPLKDFHINKRSEFFKNNYYHVTICRDCINSLFKKLFLEYGDIKLATKVCCHLTDIVYVELLCEQLALNDNPTFGKYVRLTNVKSYDEKSYASEMIANYYVADTEMDQKNEADNQWSESDLRNKVRVTKALGIDPFADCKDDDRKYMFNLCAEYFMDESLLDDPHKTQGVIEIVKTYKDIKNIDKIIDNEIRLGSIKGNQVNETRLNKLTATKRDFMEVINKFSKDNGISATVGSKGTKGVGSLAYHVKLLDEIDYTAAEVNLFDIQTCDGIRQIADISNASIWKQLQLSDDEKDEMILTQNKKIVKMTEQVEKLKENLRLARLALSKYDSDYAPAADSEDSDDEDEEGEV